MRTLSMLAAIILLGCNGESPTAPIAQLPPSTSGTASIWGYVHDSSGSCIRGAVVEVLDGPRAGAKATQTEACSVWDYSGGYAFNELPMNTNIRMRASKEGYQSVERTFRTSNGGLQSSFLLMPE